MRVSVIMPVRDGAAHVASAVRSVLDQRGAEVELLFHDDGSADGTLELLRALADADRRVSVSSGPNRGPAAARNRLLERATGEFIGFLDHDDVWPDGRLQRQLDRLDADPAAPGIIGLSELSVVEPTGNSRVVLTGLLQAGLFRRAAVRAAGLFDPGLAAGDDFDFLLRLVEAGGPLLIDHDIAVRYRIHPGQRTADRAVSGAGTVAAIARSLQRRRDVGRMETVAADATADDRGTPLRWRTDR